MSAVKLLSSTVRNNRVVIQVKKEFILAPLSPELGNVSVISERDHIIRYHNKFGYFLASTSEEHKAKYDARYRENLFVGATIHIKGNDQVYNITALS